MIPLDFTVMVTFPAFFACGDGCGLIFSGGVTVGKVGEDEIIDTLIYMCEHDGEVPSLK